MKKLTELRSTVNANLWYCCVRHREETVNKGFPFSGHVYHSRMSLMGSLSAFIRAKMTACFYVACLSSQLICLNLRAEFNLETEEY